MLKGVAALLCHWCLASLKGAMQEERKEVYRAQH
jgi:hypothetical protein